MPSRTAATRLSEEKHARAKSRADALGMSMSDYLEGLVDRDLSGMQGETGGGPDAAELRVLIDKFGKLLNRTRATVNNLAVLRLQMLAGEIDPATFEWREWAKRNLG